MFDFAKWKKEKEELHQWGIQNIKDFPHYGDLMTVDEWKASIEMGGFIDYDGSGDQVLFDEELDTYVIESEIYPSIVNKLNPKTEYIIWYNR